MMYPSDKQIEPSQSEEKEKLDKNPEGASVRGLWSDSIFLQKTGTVDFNKMLTRVQFADSHGHGWIYKNVYQKDRKGNLLDAEKKIISPEDPNKWRTLLGPIFCSSRREQEEFAAHFAAWLEQRPALQQAVESADHLPVEPLQHAIRRLPVCIGLRQTFTRDRHLERRRPRNHVGTRHLTGRRSRKVLGVGRMLAYWHVTPTLLRLRAQ